MAYNEMSLTRVQHLRELARRVEKDYATKASVEALAGRVDGLVTAGGEPNVITEIKVNGAVQAVTDKSVNITVPTDEMVNSAVSAAIDGLVNGAPETYDTLKEIAEYIEEHKEASDALAAAIGQKVDKEEGKSLSTNDYSDEDKAKLAGLTVATDAEVKEMLDEVFGAEEAQGA